jgi:hypothetical protein
MELCREDYHLMELTQKSFVWIRDSPRGAVANRHQSNLRNARRGSGARAALAQDFPEDGALEGMGSIGNIAGIGEGKRRRARCWRRLLLT